MRENPPENELLRSLSRTLELPPGSFLRGLSELFAPLIPHTALLTLTADSTGGRMQCAGDAALLSRIKGIDIDQLRRDTKVVDGAHHTTLSIGNETRNVLQLTARNRAILFIIEPGSTTHTDSLVSTWNIVALHLQERADHAAPAYLQHARATAGTRIEALTTLTDDYSWQLGALSATLRSKRLSDHDARRAALTQTLEGLKQLRTTSEQIRCLSEESVTTAFARMRSELLSLTKYRDISLQFIAPPKDGRPLPDSVARGAQAIARHTLLNLFEVPEVTRVRIRWDCDGKNLLMYLRDDGPGTHRMEEMFTRTAEPRVRALAGKLSVEATSGWGTALTATLPLDPPRASTASAALAGLRPREIEVAGLLTEGARNRAIADRLGISENTVKFHVSRILKQLGADSRTEAIAMLLAAQHS